MRIGFYFIISPQITLKLLLSDGFVEVEEGYRPVFFSNRCIALIHCKKVLKIVF